MSLRKKADLLFIPESLNFSSSMYCSSSFKWNSLRLVRVLFANSDTSFLKNGYKKTAVKFSMFTTVCFNGYLILDRIIQVKLYQIIDKRSRTSKGNVSKMLRGLGILPWENSSRSADSCSWWFWACVRTQAVLAMFLNNSWQSELSRLFHYPDHYRKNW